MIDETQLRKLAELADHNSRHDRIIELHVVPEGIRIMGRTRTKIADYVSFNIGWQQLSSAYEPEFWIEEIGILLDDAAARSDDR